MVTQQSLSLGEFLRQERERRGITIEQVASATKVGIRNLHSLESDHYTDLPAKPFIRGFVTSYSRFIGLDPKEVLARFEDFIHQKALERPNREGGHSGYAFEKRDGEQQSRTVLMIAMLSFILLGGVAMFVFKPSLHRSHSSRIEKLKAANTLPIAQNSPTPLASTPPSAATSPAAQPVKQPVVQPQSSQLAASVSPPAEVSPPSSTASTDQSVLASQPGGNPADPLDSGLDLKREDIHHKIIFKVQADIWVRFRVDQRPVRKFVVRSGKVLILRAKDQILFQVSNPNSLTYSYNGKETKLVSLEKRTVVRQGNVTLFFPNELSAKISKPFDGETSLPETPDPQSETSPDVQEETTDG